ncbi:hypothetical protein EVAR_43063_1 [Eumeta japonica]|uniref:Uncharacterized protein n=1 Tax=Eumeta variegata TaxID=151549 RepID=A0A4C1WYZ1_EUMVA|nr:hypothetical protein EVAR_43063_1 [Eumeta japonica]
MVTLVRSFAESDAVGPVANLRIHGTRDASGTPQTFKDVCVITAQLIKLAQSPFELEGRTMKRSTRRSTTTVTPGDCTDDLALWAAATRRGLSVDDL